ncbi:hypothetical protein GGG17_01050 [Arsenicicoccus sp. MKL-02]|uniref:PPIase cyclophilin-type domain-containing protein n=1 Tax=Arsenicicoccus cauae TaxID=2663847 RepID=A0A6I3IFN3_9MICO|nr:hypothetical protein [Arsenicicoccus cauae]
MASHGSPSPDSCTSTALAAAPSATAAPAPASQPASKPAPPSGPTTGACGFTPLEDRTYSTWVGLPPDPKKAQTHGKAAVVLQTNRGDIPLVLDKAGAPCTVQSFLFLIRQKLYDGTLAMANGGPDTNGSQFFLVYEGSRLRPDYTVFGQVTEEGMQVLDQIAAGGIDPGTEGTPEDGAPALTTVIERAKRTGVGATR